MSTERQQAPAVQAQKPRKTHSSSLAVKITMLPLMWSLTFIGMVIGSLMISILIEWAGMATSFWEIKGSNHSYQMLVQEISYLNEDFKESYFPVAPFDFARAAATNAHYYLFEFTYFNALLDAIAEQRLFDNKPELTTKLHSAYQITAEYIKAAMNITELIAVRMSIAILSIAAFISIFIVSAIDGFVERDLRKFGGGMERAMVYHYVKPHAKLIVIVSWVAYLSMPFSIHPNHIFIPAAALWGLVIFVTTSSFKKFL